ncbi:hypothetical protein DC3_08300 [Deinococcus cellulosilyticus NBRC 106333 = KACC 11606]|uniref:Uncharacterized protein n=1 Tax=Deinococcus cellulosilyticus (strain DSM 18568 / NBRC 106333 / KACC 11606 / 5516J-15) TaxID=1223518 RepID=A0A511MX83_DEIC1|nr:hypothetical protein DC3_08300 [Deinococcus cellulosilyticus NBRC 106333 = KACC 11606]
MISIRQTLIDVSVLLIRKPLVIFWSFVTGFLTGLTGQLLLGTGAAALQRYLIGGLRGEKGQGLRWDGVFTTTHLLLSLLFMGLSFLILLFFGGASFLVLDLLANTMITLIFLYSFVVARADLTVAQVLQQNAELIRKGDLWKQVALVFLWSYLQYLAGSQIPAPNITFNDMMNLNPDQAEELLRFFMSYALMMWVSYTVGSMVVASWYHQLTDPARQKDKIELKKEA